MLKQGQRFRPANEISICQLNEFHRFLEEVRKSELSGELATVSATLSASAENCPQVILRQAYLERSFEPSTSHAPEYRCTAGWTYMIYLGKSCSLSTLNCP